MSRLERLTRAQKAELLARERAAHRALVSEYGLAMREVQRDLRELAALIDEARRNGDPVDARWLARQARYQRWLDLTAGELARYVTQAAPIITGLQDQAVGQALRDAPTLIAAAQGAPANVAAVSTGFTVPPADVVRNMVGRAMDGTPLADLLLEAVGHAHEHARRTLIQGVIRGHGPRQIARDTSRATGMASKRALLIARTETLGAYRQVSLDTYRANRNVVAGWTWMATLDRRTCAVCWAMHGTDHTLDENLSSHPACRCAAVPRTRSWRDLGIDLPDTRPDIPTGVSVFDTIPEPDKLAILGAGKLEAYNAGLLTLTDLVQPTSSPRWGPGLREASLSTALAAA